MFGGTKHSSYIGGALLAACMFATGPAGAADLAGGCCADLEERVAELEATTARKGNRVVSLQISGTVNEALLAFDDGVDSDAYIVTNTGYQSRINFIGTGQISPDLKAGFVITLGVFGSPSFAVDQTNDESISPAVGARPDEIFIRESKVYIESERLGRLTIGQQGTAADDITAINVARSLYVDSSAQQVFVGGFQLRNGDALTGFRFLHLMGSDATNPPGDAARFDVIRYDSPSIAGFKVSASWGVNDMWDVALRYAGLLGGRFKAAAGIAYGARTDADGGPNGVAGSNINGCIIVNNETDCHQIGMSGSIMDMGTGLFIHAAYGINTDENKDEVAGALGLGNVDEENSFFYLQGGIEKKWMPYGATTLFAMYGQFDTGFTSVGLAPGVAGSLENGEVEMWGLGINQNFESASLDLYLKYNHYTASADNVVTNIPGDTPSDIDFNDFDVIYAGARLTF
jgi:predicted porin